jgi:hypothetical protein
MPGKSELDNLKTIFLNLKAKGEGDEIDSKEARVRGQDFEKIVNDVFKEKGMLVKPSYFTGDNRSQQIDGAVKIGKFRNIVLFPVINEGHQTSQQHIDFIQFSGF